MTTGCSASVMGTINTMLNVGSLVKGVFGSAPKAMQMASVGSKKIMTAGKGLTGKLKKPRVDRSADGGVPDNWRKINPAGAQINAPKGFTTYRTPDGDMVHVSPAGLKYGPDPKFGNRVDHVLDHTAPNSSKPVHSVFSAKGREALDIVDEAWMKRGLPSANDPSAYVVNMGRTIGTAGETSVRIITRPGTNEIITAYPF